MNGFHWEITHRGRVVSCDTEAKAKAYAATHGLSRHDVRMVNERDHVHGWRAHCTCGACDRRTARVGDPLE